MTKIKNASVKVMLSYDYSHFEASMSLENDNGLDIIEIDDARKKCQRLADKAVAQYKKAKNIAANRSNNQYEKDAFKRKIAQIKEKQEGDRTINEIAALKQWEDETWERQFDDYYDYNDDADYSI